MPSQMMAVSNNPRLRRNQIAELNARQNRLPEILANQQRQQDLMRADEMKNIQIDQFNRQHRLAKKTRKANDRASQIGMGLSAGKLGLSIGNEYGGKSFGQIGEDIKGTFGYGNTPSGKTGTYSGSGIFGNLSAGSFAGGGLAGFGASQMLGGKSKLKKGLLGAGVGAALGMFSGNNAFGGGLSGGVGGLIGGLLG
jgi:hypothetical protein